MRHTSKRKIAVFGQAARPYFMNFVISFCLQLAVSCKHTGLVSGSKRVGLSVLTLQFFEANILKRGVTALTQHILAILTLEHYM